MKRTTALIAAFFFAVLVRPVLAAAPPVVLSADLPGIAQEEPDTLLLAVPIVNRGKATAASVKITSIKLTSAELVMPKTLPISIGDVAPKERAVIQVTFSSRRLLEKRRYVLTLEGSYVLREQTFMFSDKRPVSLPTSSPGSALLHTTKAPPHSVRGAPFRHRDVVIDEDVNQPGRPVPTGTHQGNVRPMTPATKVEPGTTFTHADYKVRDPAMLEHQAAPVSAISDAKKLDTASHGVMALTATNDLVFIVNTPFGATQGQPNDPSGSSGGSFSRDLQVVLATGNTYGSLSTDRGHTFKQLDPTTIFPNVDGGGKLIDGGLCCDQVVHYSPSVNRFFWLMQFRSSPNNQNRLRLAAASPEALVRSGGTAWTYWDLTSAMFNLGNNSMDYPDLSVGDNYLYLSVDADGSGLLMARIPLIELRDGTTLNIGYTNPSDGSSAYGVHLIQNPGDEIFWAGHPTNNVLRMFSCKEGSNSYTWRDVKINGYPTGDFASLSPDGSNWLGSLFSGGPGGVRLVETGRDEIWFEWMGARGGGFPHPHVQYVRINHADFTVIEQAQIWNPNFAFGYASFTAANLVVGVSLAYGGGGLYGTPAVGIIGDQVVYQPCASSANAFRYGDYTTVRQASPNGALFSAEVYCVSRGPTFDPRYILFGRSADVNPLPIAVLP